MANTLIVYHYQEKTVAATFSEKEMLSLKAEPSGRTVYTGDIYMGTVTKVLPALNAAFVKVSGEDNWYLPLEKSTKPIGSLKKEKQITAGDEILVQVEKEAAKNKAVTVIGNINLTGCYFVILHGNSGTHISKKITDKETCSRLRALTEEVRAEKKIEEASFGIMLRTNAQFVTDEVLRKELTYLLDEYSELLRKAKHTLTGTCLWKGLPNYLAELRDSYSDRVERYVTDDPEIFREMKHFLTSFRPDDAEKLELYQDSMVSLPAVYRMEGNLSEVLGKKVWLKSGAYLVIEQTEAMVVVDVNSGKGSADKKVNKSFLETNKEAARELCRQMRLRNLSGIIMVDFINLHSDSEIQELLDYLRIELKKDRVKTELVEMTKLGLVEITREKTGKPTAEAFR